MSSDASPGLRQVLLILAAMFAFSRMAFFTRGAQAHILGVSAWRAILVFGDLLVYKLLRWPRTPLPPH